MLERESLTTLADAARELGVDYFHARYLARLGRLERVKVRHRVLVTRASVDAMHREQARRAALAERSA